MNVEEAKHSNEVKHSNTSQNKSKRGSRTKSTAGKKRDRNDSDMANQEASSKRAKIDDNTEQITKISHPNANLDKIKLNQAFLEEYNKLKTIYEEERVNQQSHLYLRRIAHDKTKQYPYLSKYPLLQYV